MDTAVSGLIGSGLNFVSQMLTNAEQKDMMEEQMKFNQKESALQRQFAVQQWERENAYNTPSAQIERLKAAGVNPALAYSQGSLQNTAGASPSMSNASAGGLPTLHAPQVDPLTMAQIENIKADTQSKRDSNTRENEKQGLILADLASRVEVQYSNSALMQSSIALNHALEGESRQRSNNLLQQYEQNAQSFAEELEILKSKKTLSKAEADHAEDVILANIESAKALAAYNREQTKQLPKQVQADVNQSFASLRQASVSERNASVNESSLGWKKQMDLWVNSMEQQRVEGELEKLKVDIENAKKEGKWIDGKARAEIICRYANTLCNIVDTGLSAVTGNKKTTVKGFGTR